MKSQQFLRRLSLPSSRGKLPPEQPSPGLGWKIESPPIIFHGDAASSSGALVSGLLLLEVEDESLEISKFDAVLQIHTYQKKPFAKNCIGCAEQYLELKRWTFFDNLTTLKKGSHQYPFSLLLEGHLPTSLSSPLVKISYELAATLQLASTKPSPVTGTGTGTGTGTCDPPIKLQRTLEVEVKRSLTPFKSPHHTVHLFPPTKIKADIHYEKIIYPTATGHTVQLRLGGLTSVNSETQTMEYWKLNKLLWRLEESHKTVAPACKRHTPSTANISTTNDPGGVHGKEGTPRTETRRLAEGDVDSDWTADYSTAGGHVELEFEYAIPASVLSAHHETSARGRERFHGGGYACDTHSCTGVEVEVEVEVSHALKIDMIVSQEWARLDKPHLASRRGSVRMFRINANVLVTDCPGPGVSWEKEVPPMYHDVGPSPPACLEDSCPVIPADARALGRDHL